METAPAYNITNESITLVWQGNTHVVRKGQPNFIPLRDAILGEKWDSIEANLTVARSVSAWAQGKFTVENDVISYEGKALPGGLNRRAVDMATQGKSPEPLFKFWERLQKNPSWRSVQQLWPFLEHLNIPLTDDGCFLAYKGVNPNYTDKHTGQIDNSPGQVHEMPRNEISDDPNTPCHYGYHVGDYSYAQGFGERLVVCKVDPADVVCVPNDESFRKMRVCRYTVEGNASGPLSSTVHEEEQDEQIEEFEEVDDGDCENDSNLNIFAGEEASLLDGQDDRKLAEHDNPGLAKPVEPKKWKRLQAMGFEDLMKQPIELLRKYAYKGLKIVGATKIAGGKSSLVMKILETR